MVNPGDEQKKQKRKKRLQMLAIGSFIVMDLGMIGLIIYSWKVNGLGFISIFISLIFGYTAILMTLLILSCFTQNIKFVEKALVIARPIEWLVDILNRHEDRFFKGIGIWNGLDQVMYYIVGFMMLISFIGGLTAPLIDYVCACINKHIGFNQVVLIILSLVALMLFMGEISYRVVNIIFVKLSEKHLKDCTEANINEIKNRRDEIGQARPDCDRAVIKEREHTNRQIKLMEEYDELYAKILHKKMMIGLLFVFTAFLVLRPSMLGLKQMEQADAINAVTLVTLLMTVFQNISGWNARLLLAKKEYEIALVDEEVETKSEGVS